MRRLVRCSLQPERPDAETAASRLNRLEDGPRRPVTPWLVEESALAELLGLRPPTAEAAAAAAACGVAAGPATDACQGWSDEAARFEARALLLRDGMPALYCLYAGLLRTLAQQPFPAVVASLPPRMEAVASAARLREAAAPREPSHPKGRGADQLSICPRCGDEPRRCPAASAASQAGLLHQLRRLMLRRPDDSGVRALPASDDSLLAWRCSVQGPEGTPWAGRAVELLLRFCGAWPFAPPMLFALEPRPFHPNIDPNSGAVCMDLLQEQWTPAGGVMAVLLSFRSLLASPTLDDASSLPADIDAASALLHQPGRYRRANERLAARMPEWR